MLSHEQPSAEKRRQVLGHLPRKHLQHLTDLYDLEIEDRRRRALYVEALIDADIKLFILLGILGHDDLQQLARALGLDPGDRDKQQLIDAVLTAEDPAGSAGVSPASSQLTLPATVATPAKAAKKPKKAKRPAAGGAPERSDHAELLRQLWEAAVHLRGSIEPADYKRYVLPIIFLRFLSVRCEQRRVELASEVREPASPYYAESPEEAAFVLEDEDSYRSANVFPVPAAARWEEIRKNAQADDVKIRLDAALEALELAYPLKLKGLLPRVFAGSNLSREHVTGLINLFSRDVFSADHGGADMIGKVYEYFIGEFADSEGKRGGEYFTPVSIVRTLVAMLEPERGVVIDPCCGSGGMFVQADEFTKHSRRLSFYGQESKDFTYRLCRMNLFIHGLDGDIQLGNSYLNDRHASVRADYVLANPPFNDGSKSEKGWGADRVPDKDPRLLSKELLCSSPWATTAATGASYFSTI